jgi:hypothetical protein
MCIIHRIKHRNRKLSVTENIQIIGFSKSLKTADTLFQTNQVNT